MLDIDDDSKWEQRKETKSAKAVRNALLDNEPLEARSVLFSGDLSVDEDGKHQPVGISLLELVQRTVEIVHKTGLRTSEHCSLIRNECEPKSVAWYVVGSLKGAKHMREVFKKLYQDFLHHGSRYHESKWEAGLLEFVGACKMSPTLVANKISSLGERLGKTSDQWVKK